MSVPTRGSDEWLNEPVLPKELADRLCRHVNYVYALKTAGCPFPAGLASVREVRLWLARRPDFKVSLATSWKQGDMSGSEGITVL